MPRSVLTTGEIAKLCQVAPRTASKWIDSGRLKGFRIPGSKDRRVTVQALLAFMTEHQFPQSILDNARAYAGLPSLEGDVIIELLAGPDTPCRRAAELLIDGGLLRDPRKAVKPKPMDALAGVGGAQ